jgi:outer membrane biosynthesis protein TonB
VTESNPKSRLLFAFILSLGLHLLLFLLVGNIDWSRVRETTPYRGPLVVELMEPPVPEPSPPPVPEPPVDFREPDPAAPPVPETAPAAAKPASSPLPSRSTGRAAPAQTAPSGGAYDDLFSGVTDPAPDAGRAAPEPVERDLPVSPPQRSTRAGLETAGVGTVASGDQGFASTSDNAASDSLDPDAIKELDARLAEGDTTGTTTSPGPSPAAGEDEQILHTIGDASLFSTPSLAKRAGGLPPITLNEDLRAALRRGDQPVLEVGIEFTVTPGGILKGLKPSPSSGNTSLDQELIKILMVGWTFQPALNAGEEQGRIIIRIKVE